MSETYRPFVRTIENFPKDGVNFYDISPLIGDGAQFSKVIADIAKPHYGNIDKVVGFDARGFLFAGAVAAELGVGTAMLRKAGKLPGAVHTVRYDLEYGSDSLALQVDSIQEHDRVLLIDDVIATGGTALAGIELIHRANASVSEFCTIIDLPALGGSNKITAEGIAVRALMSIGHNDG